MTTCAKRNLELDGELREMLSSMYVEFTKGPDC